MMMVIMKLALLTIMIMTGNWAVVVIKCEVAVAVLD